jgi:uncharacterized membrane protein
MKEVTDRTIENAVSTILRLGVILSGSIVLVGGAFYLALHGMEPMDHQHFIGQPAQDRLVGRIVQGALQLRPRSLIQFGILCLIATPIVRVGYSLVGFALERDRTYVFITAVVLAILLSSLLSGAAGGV